MSEVNGIEIPRGKEYVDFNQVPPSSIDANTIKSVKDLVKILSELQIRVESLEKENQALREALGERVTKKETVQLLSRVEALRLPKSGLFADNFIIRALTIYGHLFVTNLAFSLVISLLTIILFVLLGVPAMMQNMIP